MLIKSPLSPRNLKINSLPIIQMIMYTNGYSCAVLATQTQRGLFSFLATAEHHAITSPPHGRVLQIAKTLWPGSLRLLAGKLSFFSLRKINSITELQATVGGCCQLHSNTNSIIFFQLRGRVKLVEEMCFLSVPVLFFRLLNPHSKMRQKDVI